MKIVPGCCLLLTAALLCSTPAQGIAQPAARPRVVLLTADRESATVRRLVAELSALEVQVVVVDVSGTEASIRKELQRVAVEQGAFAAVRIVPSGKEAEVWVADRVTGKTLVREVVSGKDAGDFDDAVSLGTVELLRASLLEVATDTQLKGDVVPQAAPRKLLPAAKPPPTRVSQPRIEKPATARPPQAYAVFSVAPSFDLGSNQLGNGGSIDLDLKVTHVGGWGAELLNRSSFFGQEVSQPEGSATLHVRYLAVMACYAPSVQQLAPSIGVGIAAASVASTGQAQLPMTTQDEQRVRLMPVTRLGLGWRPLPSLGFRLDTTLGYSATPLEIHIASKKAAEFGRPTIAFSFGLELRLPLDAG